ncbi:MAG: bifunctional 4-hydroxy-3-methylbut-2-enyl diphosphate reductase/30S ribosomal protein S1 [Clostridia bacterium]|nr:bifunctional 4-hydroxy-3-methylbut-2-enyl diphosphate reductase/30S ribosomal protein S1 [Clostridia bacterium]
MKVRVADSAGFCFGVNRAVNMVNELADKGISVCTLGPIIHNKQVVNELEKRGIFAVDDPLKTENGKTLVIRSHGVGKDVYRCLEENHIEYADATCPFVAKIHKIVAQQSALNNDVFIAGDCEHPEVKGIMSHCTSDVYTFKSQNELENLLQKFPEKKNEPLCVVAQTTFDVEEWKKCKKIFKNLCTNAKFFDTICNATSQRQFASKELAKESDVMIVIGGRHSSNTNKLYKICSESCKTTYLIEAANELEHISFRGDEKIGITAGASTPASIIKEVLDRMSIGSEGVAENEQSFEEMMEEYSTSTSDRVKGTVASVEPNGVYVDVVGRKQTGYIPAEELSNDPNAKPEDLVKPGDELELLIMKTNDQDGIMKLSKKRVDANKNWEAIETAYNNKDIITGVVTSLTKGGLNVISNDVRVFIPASQATLRRNDSLEDLVKKTVEFRIIEINDKNRRKNAVGSIRSVLSEKNKAAKEEFWNSVEVGKKYTGTVKNLAKFGAFVDLGGVDGLIHISELSWNKIKTPSEVVNEGDTVEVYVKAIDREKKNISLGYRKEEDNPWNIFVNNYKVGDVVDVTIDGMTSYGAFAVIIPTVKGLIHISQIADRRIDKPEDELKVGEVVKAKITEIKNDEKKVSLSIRALLADKAEEAETADETEE